MKSNFQKTIFYEINNTLQAHIYIINLDGNPCA